MASKRYNTSVWIVAILMVAAFAYYFITVFLFAGTTYFKREIKLTSQEKEMIDEFESDCNCYARLYHKYDLIKNREGNHFNSSDSSLGILFSHDQSRKKGVLTLCGLGDSFLIHHATGVATKMIKTVSYKKYYKYVNVGYTSYYKRNIQGPTCNTTVTFKLTKEENIEFVRIE